jgi:hypothetical protein
VGESWHQQQRHIQDLQQTLERVTIERDTLVAELAVRLPERLLRFSRRIWSQSRPR